VVGHGAVEMLMRRAGLKGLPGSRRPRPKHQTPTAADLVDRAFSRTGRDQLWVADITEHRTREGKVYCSVPAARRAVVDEAPQWMESVAAFERRRGLLLVAVRGDQGGVQVDHQRRRRARAGVGGVLPGQCPDPGPGRGAGGVDHRQRQ
jgi:transposase InsO family protein